jgi:hypothetical protein
MDLISPSEGFDTPTRYKLTHDEIGLAMSLFESDAVSV